MVKNFSKGTEISYKYSRADTYNVSFANNISAFCFTGNESNTLKEQLKSIKKLDKHVKTIKSYSFDGCQMLQMADIGGNQLANVQSNAFSNCQNLKLVVIPPSLVTSGLGLSAISNCPSLHCVSFSGYEKDE
jgi:hypothetical protein